VDAEFWNQDRKRRSDASVPSLPSSSFTLSLLRVRYISLSLSLLIIVPLHKRLSSTTTATSRNTREIVRVSYNAYLWLRHLQSTSSSSISISIRGFSAVAQKPLWSRLTLKHRHHTSGHPNHILIHDGTYVTYSEKTIRVLHRNRKQR